MDQLFTYRVFGLNIRSEFEIPELPVAGFASADVEIITGRNPRELDAFNRTGVLYQAGRDDFLFRLDTVGSYRVQNGNRVIVERFSGATDEEIRLFLLGSAFGALLMQRDLLPFHGSTVVKDGMAFVIGGVSGAGKSSLAAVLIKRGYALLADDISVISLADGKPMVYPGIPHLKLWQDVLEKLQEDISQYPRVRPSLLKYRKPAGAEYAAGPVPLHSIIILGTRNKPGFEHKEIKGAEKFNLLKNNTYRYQYIEGLEKTEVHFRLATTIAAGSRVITLKRPGSPLQLTELADYFEKEIAG